MSRFESSWLILNRLRYRFWTHVADLFEERKITSVGDLINEEPLMEPQKKMTEELRRGIAGALSVPPEEIREDIIDEMIADLIYISKLEQGPEMAPSTDRLWGMGRELGRIYRSALLAHERLDLMK